MKPIKFKFVFWVFDGNIEREIIKEIPLSCTESEYDIWIEQSQSIIDNLENQYGLHDPSGGNTKWGIEVGYCSNEIDENDVDKLMEKWDALLTQGHLKCNL